MKSQLLDKPVVDAKKSLQALKTLSQKSPKRSIPRIEKLDVKGYEQVLKVSDEASGLRAIIAIHNTALGPALGGTRIYPYATFQEALTDVLRLSRGMTYKSAIAGVGFGGGKSVIIADPKTQKSDALLEAFGAVVDSLGGQYICAEDVGCTTEDVNKIRRTTPYVVGLPRAKSSGDPGPFTAWGTFRGIQSVLKKIYGTDSLEGRTIAVQGLGNVGGHLLEQLFWMGAHLLISDIDAAKVQHYVAKFHARAIPIGEISFVECDVFAPCAMGGILNDRTIPHLRCKAVAGSANNQLLNDEDADRLRKRGILYAPDFVINSGGLLNVSAELEEKGYDPRGPRAKVHGLYDLLLSIYEIAERNQESTHAAAMALTDYRIKYGIGKRTAPPTFHHSAN